MTPQLLSLPDQIAKHLREQRKLRKLSQAELAIAAGTSQATIAKLEAGHGNPTLGLVKRLFATLECDLSVQVRHRQ